MKETDYDRLREMIGRCQWTFAKTMPWCPHEYIVRNRCPLSDEEFLYFVDMQRRFGIPERWGPYNHPYLHIDGTSTGRWATPTKTRLSLTEQKNRHDGTTVYD